MGEPALIGVVRRLAARAALVTALIAVLLGFAAPASWADNTDAVKSFGGCLNAERKGDLMLLFDESKSLKNNDPENLRVAAAHYLITRLNSTTGALKLDLSIRLAAFSDDFHPVLAWTKLDDGAGTAQVQSGIDAFDQRNDGVQTDYWNGLNGARADLAQRRTKDDPDRCQAIVWFSDGRFSVHLKPDAYEQNVPARTKDKYAPDVGDLRDRGQSDRARELAVANLCAPKGLADQVRVGKITLFGIGLEPKVSDDGDDNNFDTMRKVATGEAGCGARQRPTPGSFNLVKDIADLLFAFDQILDDAKPKEANICEAANPTDCRAQGHSFVLDSSVTRAHILAASGNADAKVYLLAPGGKAEPLTRDGTDLKTVKGTYQWLPGPNSLTVDLEDPDQTAKTWTGRWTLVFLEAGGGTSKASISISGNLLPAWPAQQATKLYTGEKVSGLAFGIVNDVGAEKDSSLIPGTGTLAVELDRANADPLPIVSGLPVQQVTGATAKPLDLTAVPPGPATLKLTLDLTTKSPDRGPGTHLSPQVVNIPVDILPPRGAPPIGDLIDFGSIEGDVDATATLTATGPGCVWLDAAAKPDVDALPNGMTVVDITSSNNAASGCLQLPDGQRADLPLRLTAATGGNGTLSGTVPITVKGPGAQDQPTVVSVRFTANAAKPIQPLTFGLAFIGALILGPGIPLLLLALFKRLTATIPGQTLVAQEMPIVVEGGQVLRDGAPLALRDSDFTQLVPLKAKGSRVAEVGSLTLRTRTGPSPFGAGYVVAEAPGQVGLSSEHPRPFGRGQAARLPLAVHNTWVATRVPGAPAGTATVTVLSGLDPDGSGRRKLLEDVQSRLPDLMSELGDTEPPAPGSTDPFASPSGPGGPPVDPFANFDAGGWSDPFAAPTSARCRPPVRQRPQRPSCRPPRPSSRSRSRRKERRRSSGRRLSRTPRRRHPMRHLVHRISHHRDSPFPSIRHSTMIKVGAEPKLAEDVQ